MTKKMQDLQTKNPHDAASNGDFDSLWWLLNANDFYFDSRNSNDDVPAQCAVMSNQIDNLKWLVLNDNTGASTSAVNKQGRTSAHLAAFLGHLECLQMTLHRRVINCPDNDGNTPLHLAALGGHLNCLSLLIERHADINAVNNLGQTSAHVAAKEGHIEFMKGLVSNSASILVPDNDGYTPQDLATQCNHNAMARYLNGVRGTHGWIDIIHRILPVILAMGAMAHLFLAVMFDWSHSSEATVRVIIIGSTALALLRLLASTYINNATLYFSSLVSYIVVDGWLACELFLFQSFPKTDIINYELILGFTTACFMTSSMSYHLTNESDRNQYKKTS